VETNTDYGISLYHSDNNNLSSNVVSNNDLGFWVESGINNNISRNSVKANFDYGIKFVDTSSKNTIFENEIMNQPCGIDLYRTNFNKVSANNITGNSQYGILLEREDCFDNTISENNIVDNYYGISDYSSSNNIMYHNNFLNNTIQADIHYSVNVWDNGYPSGGNYWSDYTGFDNRSGLNQDKPRSDGICDSPYVINENNTDKYPLMKPWKSVTMIGDVNHDGIVDILDIVHISSIYHCQEGELDWNPEADLAPPYGIIDMLDLVTCVFHYGEKWK
jgi:parallel beta-helix repeat protein